MAAIPASIGMGVLRKIAAQSLAQGPTTVNMARGVSKELFGYDFVGLIVKIAVLQIIAWLFAKFMESVISLTGGWFTFLRLLGFTVPAKEGLPPALIQLFTTGYNGFKFWDFVKALTLALIIFEAMQYYKSNKENGGQPSPMTLGIFTLLIGGVGIITIPELMHRVRNGGSTNITLSRTSGSVGDTFTVTVNGLVPATLVEYGWNKGDVNVFKTSFNADLDGSFSFEERILATTSAGIYTIYFDQTASGGPRFTKNFEVLGGIAN